MPTVTLIHATAAAIAPIVHALERLPDVHVLNLLDEALLTEVERHGGVTDACRARMATHLELAADAGSDAVLVTCNVYSPVIAEIRDRFAPMVVLAVDEPMVELAVRSGHRIGVIGTVANGLHEQTRSIAEAARRTGRTIDVLPVLRPEAFTALSSGDAAAHDAIILDALAELAPQVDLVVLAQASMSRVMPLLPPPLRDRVLASPDLAVEELARRIGLATQRVVAVGMGR